MTLGSQGARIRSITRLLDLQGQPHPQIPSHKHVWFLKKSYLQAKTLFSSVGVRLRKGVSVSLAPFHGARDISMYASKMHLILAMAPEYCIHEIFATYADKKAIPSCTCRTFVQVEWLQDNYD